VKSNTEFVRVDCPACGNVNRKARRACLFCDGTGNVRKSIKVATTDELLREAEEDAAIIQAAIDGNLKL